ncbi:hypothetical protein BpJC7_19080 [Weizmannia acidilactici]|uniref:HTH-type transcriptional regulator NsrR n=1 Tax=Weizmannia acidilactici TaxID=2607726 RepID=A0A5J4JIT5_9BACI|nr:hypothetical protein BpJC4_11940 [Weizmannia acidilactici]GER70605.1 hypothetical protein BpJC7_19080 [Weizmannia acidilactici]
MRLTNYSDYALRELISLASMEDGKLASIKEIADDYGISKNHLMKITYELSKIGGIKTVRGRGGGICLAKPPRKINIGKSSATRKTTLNWWNAWKAGHVSLPLSAD